MGHITPPQPHSSLLKHSPYTLPSRPHPQYYHVPALPLSSQHTISTPKSTCLLGTSYITHQTHHLSPAHAPIFSLYLSGGHQLIEDVVVPLLGALEGDAGLLQEVVLHHTTLNVPWRVKANLHELPKSAWVVITDRLGVTCMLKDR